MIEATDDNVIAEAQSQLLANRAQLDRRLAMPSLAHELGPSTALLDLLARGAAFAIPAPESVDPSAGPARAPMPSGVRDVTWDNLASLRGPEGAPSLGGVESRNGILTGPAAVDFIRAQVSGKAKIVLLGETGAGKSVTAAAWLTGRAPRVGRARWLSHDELASPQTAEWALAGDAVVLDNLGYELGNAPPNSPLCAQRAQPAMNWIDKWARRRPGARRLVVTTWLDFGQLTQLYGGGARRVYEGATVIKIVRAGGTAR